MFRLVRGLSRGCGEVSFRFLTFPCSLSSRFWLPYNSFSCIIRIDINLVGKRRKCILLFEDILIVSVGGRLEGDALVPLVLLVFAVQTAVTTGTCVVDMFSWEGFAGEERIALSQLYVPYLALCKSFLPHVPHFW